MSENRSKMLVATISKLFRRGAESNIVRILEKTHAADIAAVLDALDTEARISIFQLNNDLSSKAEVLSHLKLEMQKEILAIMTTSEVEEIVSQMDKDDAADLLGYLPDEEAKKILNAMVLEDSEDVEELMGYPEDSAGGLMSSDYFALSDDCSVADAIKNLQEQDNDLVAFYLYVVNETNKIVGVISLKQLLLSRPSTLLKDIMSTDVISVNIGTNQAEVAQVVEKYDFLSVPVIDVHNVLQGVITVDDVIDVIRAEAQEDILAMGRAGFSGKLNFWSHVKSRFPWTLLAFLGGLICFCLVHYFFGKLLKDNNWKQYLTFVSILPLVLIMGATTGSQAVTYCVGVLRNRKSLRNAKKHIFLEFFVGLFLGLSFSLFTVLFSFLFKWSYESMLFFSFVVFLQISFATLVGTLIPIVLNKFGVDVAIGSIPIYTVISDVSSVTLLFGLGYLLF